MVKSSSPIYSHVCLLSVQFYRPSCRKTHTKLKQNSQKLLKTYKLRIYLILTLTSLHLLAEFDVFITMVFGHFLSSSFVGSLIRRIIVCHSDPMRFHWMPLSIVICHTILPCQTPFYRTAPLLPSVTGQQHIREYYTESQNYQGWKRPRRSSSPAITNTSQLNHIHQHNIQMFLEHSHGR
uniref:Uncharacterized protein n=1 Tax=Coturnix japonica TaxID=93934 RepID=A0A8C2Y9U4_COTJA